MTTTDPSAAEHEAPTFPEYSGDPDALVDLDGPERILKDLDGEIVPIDGLEHWPGNARVGDVASVADSLCANGQFRSIMVQKSSGRVVYGNHTLEAARDVLHWRRVSAVLVDIPDEQARRIALADNKTADKATWNEEALLAELKQLPDLKGTGFEQLELDDLVKKFGDSARAGAGEIAPPDSFGQVNPDDLAIEHRCPRCGYEWSGKAQ